MASTKRFAKIYVEISNACNLACDFCPSGVSDKQAQAISKVPPSINSSTIASGSQNSFTKTYVTHGQLRHILREGRDLTEQFTFHVLGEPTAHPYFAEFVEIARQESTPLNITTNGILIHKPEIRAALLNPAVRQVNFSLQSWTANFKIENLGGYLKRVFDFIDQAMTERPDLYINLRLWNVGSREENLLHNLHFLQPIEEKYGPQLVEDATDSLTKIKTNVEMKKSHRITGRLYLHFDSRFEWPDPAHPVRSQSGYCYGLKNHIGVLANGTVVPCCLDSNGYINLGNIHEKSLSEILAGPRAKKVYHGFEKYQLIEDLCQKCTYIGRFDSKVGTNLS